MAWISVLIVLVSGMIALEGLGAERNFRRSIEPREPREWENALLDELLFGRPR
jgi:hypothetical protein